jgi:hypothetical protein
VPSFVVVGDGCSNWPGQLRLAEGSAVTSPYSSRIIKAGALLGDTKTLLSHWDVACSVSDNIQRIHRENLFGKASRSRVEDILTIFRQRYLREPSVTNALVTLTRARLPGDVLDRLLYFHAARSDQLVHDTVTEILVPLYERGVVEIPPALLQSQLSELLANANSRPWSAVTLLRATQSLLATLRDFGVLQGAVNKKIAPAFLPITAFAYIAFYLKQHQPSGAKLLELPDWKLFFLTREAVEKSLLEAHQQGLLEYHVAGSTTRLTFPVSTLEEFADVITQRASHAA